MLHFLHIPRTGGSARNWALRHHKEVKTSGHHVRLSQVDSEDQPVIFLRDPIARFRSAWDHADHESHALLHQWPTAESFALDIEAASAAADQRRIILFRKMEWWFDVERPVWTVAVSDDPLETEARVNDILDRCGLVHVRLPRRTDHHFNATAVHSDLSPQACESLARFYAADLRLFQDAGDAE